MPSAANPTRRLEALSDGVFAIAMTVMALELTATVDPELGLVEMWPGLWPRLLAYVMSFMILSLFWMGQKLALETTTETRRRHHVTHLLFLMIVAAIPFPAALLGTHPDAFWAFAVYGGTLTGAALLLELSVRQVGDPEDPRRLAVERRLASAVLGYGGSLLLAAVSPVLGLFAFGGSHAAMLLLPLRRGRTEGVN